VINLLMRFYDTTQGRILIDGTDIRDATKNWLRSKFGIVLQTPYLFCGTVKENIRYGKLDAPDDDIENAAISVGLHDFILELPDGYNTKLKEDGEPFSTGQKQLVSLARAVLADPKIFIMDEATSSVDTETEFQVQQATESLIKGRTCFVIAHRLTTIRRADRILVIDKGRIVESGTHSELIRKQGYYYRLYAQQFLCVSTN